MTLRSRRSETALSQASTARVRVSGRSALAGVRPLPREAAASTVLASGSFTHIKADGAVFADARAERAVGAVSVSFVTPLRSGLSPCDNFGGRPTFSLETAPRRRTLAALRPRLRDPKLVRDQRGLDVPVAGEELLCRRRCALCNGIGISTET